MKWPFTKTGVEEENSGRKKPCFSSYRFAKKKKSTMSTFDIAFMVAKVKI